MKIDRLNVDWPGVSLGTTKRKKGFRLKIGEYSFIVRGYYISSLQDLFLLISSKTASYKWALREQR